MEKPTKKKLRQMLSTFSVQQKVVHPPVLIQKNLNSKIKSFLTLEGMQLLTDQINNIIEKEKLSIQDKNKLIEQQDFNLMKKNLKIYGKNKNQYRVQKIIKVGHESSPQPLKHIVKIHENRFMIAKQYNIKLSHKIDAIIQQQNIIQMKNSKREHLQSKLHSPLIKQLRRFRSTHQMGRTDRLSQTPIRQCKQQSSWTQRAVGFGGCIVSEEKSMEKYKRDNRPKMKMEGIFNLRRQRNSAEGLMGAQKQNLERFTNRQEGNNRLVYKGHIASKLKRKGILYN